MFEHVKIYRNSYDSRPIENDDFSDGHGGYSFHPSKAEAIRAAKKSGLAECVAVPLDVPTSKEALIKWLNAYAAYPNNG